MSGIALETARLLIRSFRPDDAAAFFEIFGDPEVVRLTQPRPLASLEEACARIEQLIAIEQRVGYTHRALIVRETGQLVGGCGFRATVDAPRVLELGFALRPSAWGKGFIQEATAVLVAEARASLGLERVIALTAPENVRARRTLARLGMGFEGEVEEGGVVYARYGREV